MEVKAQEREKTKETRHAEMLASREVLWQTPSP